MGCPHKSGAEILECPFQKLFSKNEPKNRERLFFLDITEKVLRRTLNTLFFHSSIDFLY